MIVFYIYAKELQLFGYQIYFHLNNILFSFFYILHNLYTIYFFVKPSNLYNIQKNNENNFKT